MQRRPDLVAQPVLQLRELFGQVPHVVVVHQRQRTHRLYPPWDLGSGDLRARQIAEELGARTAPLRHQDVELAQQGRVDGDAEPDQAVLHRSGRYPTDGAASNGIREADRVRVRAQAGAAIRR